MEIVVLERRGDRFCVFGRGFGGVGEDTEVDAVVVFEDVRHAELLLHGLDVLFLCGDRPDLTFDFAEQFCGRGVVGRNARSYVDTDIQFS